MAGPRNANVLLLGPQRDPTELPRALDRLGVQGTIALITAGWQENEDEDEALQASLGRPSVNLALHERSEQVFAEDTALREASAERQRRLHRMQEFYRLRLDAIDEADHAISVRHARTPLLDEELDASVDQFRALDAMHLRRVVEVHRAFEASLRTATRPAVARHRAEIDRIVRDAGAVVVSGGHVMSLLNRMRLFDALAAVGRRPIFAWSAGAMALTERVVLFHDAPPFGKNLAQVVDAGLGLCPGVVALPDAERRVDADATRGISRFSRRMAPAACRTLNAGEWLRFEAGALVEASSATLRADGRVAREEGRR